MKLKRGLYVVFLLFRIILLDPWYINEVFFPACFVFPREKVF